MPLSEFVDSSGTFHSVSKSDPFPIDPTSRLYDPQTGKYQRISPTGAAIFDQSLRLIGGGFSGNVFDSVAWTVNNSGAGSSTGLVNGIATLTSGTANNGYATIQSATKARFLFASANLFRGTARIVSLDSLNTTRSWGAFNFGSLPAIQDGFFFSYDGSSKTLSVNCCNSGVVTSSQSGSFNGDVSSYVLDTNQHNFEILYQATNAFFFIDGVLLHRFSATSSPLSSYMHLSASALAKNSASGTASASFEAWSGSIVRYGGTPPSPQYVNLNTNGTTVVKVGPGTLHSVTLNLAGANTNNITLYDNTAGSGATIATISNDLGSLVTLQYGLDFVNGLTVVMANGVANDITVIYD